MNFQHRVTVMGGGSFGTVLANIVAHNGFPVSLWLRDQYLAEEMRQTRVNSRYVPGLYLHDDLEIVTDFKRCVSHADTLIFSVPSKAFRGVLEQVKDFINDQQFLVTTAKGIEPDHFLLMSQLHQFGQTCSKAIHTTQPPPGAAVEDVPPKQSVNHFSAIRFDN